MPEADDNYPKADATAKEGPSSSRRSVPRMLEERRFTSALQTLLPIRGPARVAVVQDASSHEKGLRFRQLLTLVQ